MRAVRLGLLAGLLAGLLSGAGSGAAAAADGPPAQPMRVGTALAPGNSGFFSVAGQARGTATGNPGDYGPNVDDQRVMFWSGRTKDGRFAAPTGPPDRPRPGVRVYTDAAGVKQVYGDTAYDTWFGAGYAAGQQRLFLADAVRRLGRGTFAELVGPSGVPGDVQTRTLTYSDADYGRMFAALPDSSRTVIEGYAAGLDAWIQHVRSTPADLPAEYVLLSSLPERWTVTDTLAAGVLITRTVASAGGNEFDNVAVLRALGGLAALDRFADLRWQDDRRAAVTVPPQEGTFDNAVVPAGRRAEVLRRSAGYAMGLPPELASGPGTGAAAAPTVPSGVGLPPLVRSAVVRAAAALVAFGRGLHGGSYAFAVAPRRTTTGAAMLVSGPQLGYSYPDQLWEVEVHGGGYDARGATVPGLPTIGIGYGRRVAWGLTTGNSKTIDSFIETTRRVDGALEYLHRGAWRRADCRVETIRYRQAPRGVPTGPPVFTQQAPVCRTVHGPVVASTADGSLARSMQYAMYGRELETVTGILQWNRARNLAEFEEGVRMVTWNENVVYADADGRIAYWHPGLFPLRSPDWDSRFPAPGTGRYDTRGTLPFARMPQVVDPAAGYVANWNGKPAVGWLDEYLDPASSRPGGPAQRVQVIQRLLAGQQRMSPANLVATEYRLGTVDQRAPEFLGLVSRLTGRTAGQRGALALLRGWDGTSYGSGAGTSAGELTDAAVTDGPAPTLFRRYLDDLRDEVLASLPRDVVLGSDAVGSHVYDASVADNLVLRALVPQRSGLPTSRDYLAGRSAEQVMLAALDRSVAALIARYGADPARWRARHERRPVNSLTGVIGPSLTMPYQDRGTWLQIVSFTGPVPPVRAGRRGTTAPSAGRPLPATGGGPLPDVGVVVVLLAVAARRVLLRRR